jgi:hypothetical protein
VGGLLGVVLEATFEREGTHTHLTAHFFGRGQQLVTLTFLRPRGLPEYQRVFDRILESVQPAEPGFLREARATVLLSPANVDALLSLASAEPWALTAQLAFAEGLPSEGCSLAGRARLMDPRGPDTLVAVGECALARGDRLTALARLREAEKLRPDDLIRARVERLEDELRE